MPQFQSYITLKIPSKLNVRFQRYSYVIVMLKTIKYKGNWVLLLALSKNQFISEFWLILLDHITFILCANNITDWFHWKRHGTVRPVVPLVLLREFLNMADLPPIFYPWWENKMARVHNLLSISVIPPCTWEWASHCKKATIYSGSDAKTKSVGLSGPYAQKS